MIKSISRFVGLAYRSSIRVHPSFIRRRFTTSQGSDEATAGSMLLLKGIGVAFAGAIASCIATRECSLRPFNHSFVSPVAHLDNEPFMNRDEDIQALSETVRRYRGYTILLGKTRLVLEACKKGFQTTETRAITSKFNHYWIAPTECNFDLQVDASDFNPIAKDINSDGCIYIHAPCVAEHATKALGRALAAPFLPTQQPYKLNNTFFMIERAAKIYKAETSKTPVLVIDHVDNLLKQEASLAQLVAQANEWSEQNLLHVVFVVTSTTIPDILIGRHFTDYKEYTIQDIPTPSAVKYLVQNGICEKLAEQVVTKVTGNRLFWINNVFHGSHSNFEEIQESIHSHMRRHVHNGILGMYSHHLPTAEILSTIMKSPSKTMSYEQFFDITKSHNLSYEEAKNLQRQLLDSEVIKCFSYHSITIQSPAMQTFLEKNPQLYTYKSRLLRGIN